MSAHPHATIPSCLLALCLVAVASTQLGCSDPPPPNDKYDGTCDLKITDSPEIRGLRLGMSIEEVKQRYPALNLRPADEKGETGVLLAKDRPHHQADSGVDLTGIKTILLSFLDNRLYELVIDYEPVHPDFTGNDLRAKLRGELKLPISISEFELECYDFRVITNASAMDRRSDNSPHISLVDVAADKLRWERLKPTSEELEREASRRKYQKEERKAEERKKTFTP